MLIKPIANRTITDSPTPLNLFSNSEFMWMAEKPLITTFHSIWIDVDSNQWMYFFRVSDMTESRDLIRLRFGSRGEPPKSEISNPRKTVDVFVEDFREAKDIIHVKDRESKFLTHINKVSLHSINHFPIANLFISSPWPSKSPKTSTNPAIWFPTIDRSINVSFLLWSRRCPSI